MGRFDNRPALTLLASLPVLWLGAALPLLDSQAALAAVGALLCSLCWPAVLLIVRRERAPARPQAEGLMRAVTLRLDETGEAVDVAGASDVLLGVPGEMLLGGGFFDRILVADRAPLLVALTSLRDGEARLTLTLRMRIVVPGESESPYRLFTAELLRTGFEAEPVLAILRDDPEAGAAKTDLATARERFAEAEAETARLLASISHELKTPVGAMMGFADALHSETFGPLANARQAEYAELIRKAGEHAVSVVDAMANLGAGPGDAAPRHLETFDVKEAAMLCRSMMEAAAAGKKISIHADIGPGLAAVRGNRFAVQQILLNLLSNGVKFTPPGGAVTIKACRQAGQVEISVTDTGVGIAREDLPRLGTPFARLGSEATRSCEGTGLGLALVKGMAERQGGAMHVSSSPGRGTTVTITLPEKPGATGALRRIAAEAISLPANLHRENGHGPVRKTG